MAFSGMSAAKSLLERLPDKLFGPLASANRHQYWRLLAALYERRFGPDAPIPPSHGFTSREIHKDLEEEIEVMGSSWTNEDGSEVTNIQAAGAGAFIRLRESGWLRIERYGVREMTSMAPAVAQFLGRLIEFAQTGPLFVAGKVRSIEANLMLILRGEGDGSSLQEAASQARNLIEHVRNTSSNVRDIMGSFNAEMTTAQYVRRFFTDYIERVFIGDYRELRTREHPLSRRQEIVRNVERLYEDDELRQRLVNWYQQKQADGDQRRAAALFERDVARLLDIHRIDDYLDRLDDEIRRANKRALAFLDYRLRSLRPIDQLVGQAIEAVTGKRAKLDANSFAPGDMMCSARIAEPRREPVKLEATSLRAEVLSIREEAIANLRLKVRQARAVTPPGLTQFVLGAAGEKGECLSAELNVSSIGEVRMLQVLQTTCLGLTSDSSILRANAMLMARGYLATEYSSDEISGPWISGPVYRLTLRKSRSIPMGRQ